MQVFKRPLDGRAAAKMAAGFFVLALLLQLPGNVPYDGIIVWYEAETHTLFAQHPAALVLIWRLSEMVVRGPALFTALQLASLWLAVGLLLARHRPPAWAATLFCAVLLVWPPLLATAGVTVKDVFGAHLVLLAFALAAGKNPARWFAAFAVGTLAFLLRYQFGLILPLLAIAWWPERDRRTAFAGAAGIVVVFVLVNAAVAALFVKAGPGDVLLSLRKMAIFDIAGTVAHDPSTPLTVFAREHLDTVRLTREMRAQYSPVRVDTLWQTKDSGTITPTSGVFGRLYYVPDRVVLEQWRRVASERPGAFLQHRMAAFARVIGLGDIWRCRPLTPGISTLPRPAVAAVGAQAFAPALSAKIMTSHIFPVSLTFRAVVYLGLLLLVLIVGCRDARLLAGFALAYEFSFFLLPQACEVRYAYPVMLAAIVAGAMALQRRLI
ncbi:hypothetical protein [Rhizomicrobium electricum]|uniref:Glycosyltransferase RgtA/B/C/D-like domain-containing protein n=1 Tax=Rhizomicrobium electricum TaxID=480070 RepID=A0ABN1F2V7_9PROT|nr:hypothetical protein [Rhizomicrobium electricum]NIJ49253.1 hypothetical protein [Rhizomicrobium electricum]